MNTGETMRAPYQRIAKPPPLKSRVVPKLDGTGHEIRPIQYRQEYSGVQANRSNLLIGREEGPLADNYSSELLKEEVAELQDLRARAALLDPRQAVDTSEKVQAHEGSDEHKQSVTFDSNFVTEDVDQGYVQSLVTQAQDVDDTTSQEGETDQETKLDTHDLNASHASLDASELTSEQSITETHPRKQRSKGSSGRPRATRALSDKRLRIEMNTSRAAGKTRRSNKWQQQRDQVDTEDKSSSSSSSQGYLKATASSAAKQQGSSGTPLPQERRDTDVTANKTPTSALSKVNIQQGSISLRPQGSTSPATIHSQISNKTPDALSRDQKIIALANEGHLTPVQVARLKEKGTLPPEWQPPDLGRGSQDDISSDFRQARE